MCSTGCDEFAVCKEKLTYRLLYQHSLLESCLVQQRMPLCISLVGVVSSEVSIYESMIATASFQMWVSVSNNLLEISYV